MANDAGEGSKKLKLYSYWRSSCSCRVRIALNLKRLDYEYIAVNLLKVEQKAPEFLKLNPLGCVPVLVDGDVVVADSFAILLARYLEEKYPQRPLLPKDLQKKALNYQAANIICGSIQPYHNLPVIGYIKEKLGPDEMLAWVQNRINDGFSALEQLLEKYAGKYATGDEVFLLVSSYPLRKVTFNSCGFGSILQSLHIYTWRLYTASPYSKLSLKSSRADLFLAPQIDGAVKRFNINMNEFPLLAKLSESYKEHPAFEDAMPGKQPDAPQDSRN
ncbi:glutathione S-transferase [Striga asiatica]|uniref:glutathione transferase n=1 Tax=Striga asiatica TaxID=4170 RepID=A0A5A7QJY9_STRAF|nr:glutathione S-transferase [Striga asiatica]